MADELDGLLNRVEDPDLRAELRAQIDRLRAKRTFGLVFESHLPERVRLPDHPIRSGALVVERDEPKGPTYLVLHVRDGVAGVRPVRHPDGSPLTEDEQADAADREAELAALVVISDFGEPIFPGLRRVGAVERGGDKPAHVVIKGENHHVLEALRFSHAGKVDAIYIDPPYNTGARDWKYDNDYVDDTDAYRHSKWLAFMERRLLLAKELLNPDRSVLIVTIDEKEYLRLGLLLEQTFAGLDIQMVTIVSNRAGSPRSGRFSRHDEYIFTVFVGDAYVAPWTETMLGGGTSGSRGMPTVWFSAVRVGGGSALRSARPNLFYPVLLDAESGELQSVGSPLAADEPRETYVPPAGTVAVWPLSTEGREQTWRFSHTRMVEYFHAGTARLGRRDEATGQRPVTYLRPGTLQNLRDGVFTVTGRTAEGALMISGDERSGKRVLPASVWNVARHYARDYGTKLLRALLPEREFPFPKSLYAVEDTLRFFVADKPDAVVLDFFAGSGTTTHAVARLNRQDGGRRQSIVVTNNEVSAAEAEALRKAGRRPGDPEWEALGIFEHITRPRITAAVTGLTPDGEPVKGDYKFTDEFPMAEGFEENVEFAELVYLDPDDVELDLAFASIAPLLWLRAGASGPVIEERTDETGAERPFAWTERYGVLFDTDRWRAFVAERPDTATTAFIVTDSPATFAGVAADLPDSVDVVRLYENYLTTFRLDGGWG